MPFCSIRFLLISSAKMKTCNVKVDCKSGCIYTVTRKERKKRMDWITIKFRKSQFGEVNFFKSIIKEVRDLIGRSKYIWRI